MGLDHRVGNRCTPLDGANCENGKAAVAADVAQTIGKVAFALTPQAGHPMGWNAGEDIGRYIQIPQKLQPIEEAANIG